MAILHEGDWCQLQSCDKHCETGCIKTPSGPQCFCKEGYKLKEDESSCEDINECLVFGSCSQSGLCENKDGGHDCSCMVSVLFEAILFVRGTNSYHG